MHKSFSQKNIYPELLKFIRNRKPCTLCTVTKIKGSAPQIPGSSAIFNETGLVAGTVGGGISEATVQKKAIAALRSGDSVQLLFNLDHEISNTEEAICGGKMNVVVDASPEKHAEAFKAMERSLQDRIPGVLMTICRTVGSGKSFLERFWVTDENLQNFVSVLNPEEGKRLSGMVKSPVRDEFAAIERNDEKENMQESIFLEAVIPLPRLIIAGAGHIGRALSHFGTILDFEVTIWDDRTEIANKESVPDAHEILNGGLEESLGRINVDDSTYLVIVTRGHKQDADVLKMFINSPIAYIGMIGSKRKVQQMRNKFLAEEWATEEQWGNIHAPIGLAIQSKTVQEIAVSIAAQLILARSQKNRKDG